jgi:hypothetical protein
MCRQEDGSLSAKLSSKISDAICRNNTFEIIFERRFGFKESLGYQIFSFSTKVLGLRIRGTIRPSLNFSIDTLVGLSHRALRV